MVFSNFEELIKEVQKSSSMKKVAVAAAQDEHTLQAVLKAKKTNIADPVLIGNKAKIIEILSQLDENVDDDCIIDVDSDAAAAIKAVELIRDGKADFIMKGIIQTADLLKAVVNKDKGLRSSNIMTHVAMYEVPSYHKLIAITDGGMVMFPSVDEKRQIIENAVNIFISMGYECPKVAVLAAVETVNPKMPESVDAGILKKMNLNGEIKNCIVEGPISYDLVMSKESAEIKNFYSPVTEDTDILIVPNITSGNILAKALGYSANAKMAGFVVGAKVPIALTSRGASVEEKYLSVVLSAASVDRQLDIRKMTA